MCTWLICTVHIHRHHNSPFEGDQFAATLGVPPALPLLLICQDGAVSLPEVSIWEESCSRPCKYFWFLKHGSHLRALFLATHFLRMWGRYCYNCGPSYSDCDIWAHVACEVDRLWRVWWWLFQVDPRHLATPDLVPYPCLNCSFPLL